MISIECHFIYFSGSIDCYYIYLSVGGLLRIGLHCINCDARWVGSVLSRWVRF